MSLDIFGSDNIPKNVISKEYVDSKFITLTNNLKSKLDKSVTDDLDMKGHRITGLIDPIENSDVTTKHYVDSTKFNFNDNLNLNNHIILNVSNPINDTDVVNKRYVDDVIKNLVTLSPIGLIPNLTGNTNDEGFIVTSSSELSNEYAAYKAFSLSRNNQWRVAEDVRSNFWIQIECINPVKVYKFSIRNISGSLFVKWKIQGSNNSDEWIDLPFNINILPRNITSHFTIDHKLSSKYIFYRIFVEEAVGKNLGLCYWQLYTVNPILIA